MHKNSLTNEIKQEVFKTIGDKIKNSRVLDICSDLGIKAITSGSQRVEFVEPDFALCNAIRKKLNQLGFTSYARVFQISASEFIKVVSSLYDLIFALLPSDELNLEIVKQLARSLKKDGILVYSCPLNRAFPDNFDHTRGIKRINFGNMKIIFIHKY